MDGVVREQPPRLVQGLGDVYARRSRSSCSEALSALSPEAGAQVLLGQSGGDAVTAAIKTAMLVTGPAGLVAFEGAYHGLSVRAARSLRLSLELPGAFRAHLGDAVRFVPFPRDEATATTALAMLEPVRLLRATWRRCWWSRSSGAAAALVPPAVSLAAPASPEAARAAGALVIADEILDGLSRTGSRAPLRARRASSPTSCASARGSAAGLPIAACIAGKEIMAAWTLLVGGGPHLDLRGRAPRLRLRARHAARSPATSSSIAAERRRNLATPPARCAGQRRVERVRGAGLMIGVELARRRPTAQRAAAGLLARGYSSPAAASTATSSPSPRRSPSRSLQALRGARRRASASPRSDPGACHAGRVERRAKRGRPPCTRACSAFVDGPAPA